MILFSEFQGDIKYQIPVFVNILKYTVAVAKFTIRFMKSFNFSGGQVKCLQAVKRIF